MNVDIINNRDSVEIKYLSISETKTIEFLLKKYYKKYKKKKIKKNKEYKDFNDFVIDNKLYSMLHTRKILDK